MKFTSALLALLGSAAASPVALTESTEQQLDHQLERRQAIGYVQNYNGNLANFKYNQGAGTFTANWNNPGDFVVGLGWNTGTANRYDYHGR
jgi:endo-1,4-beta-xylanase